ncbi:MAG: GntR family transcriptional regulator [Filifactoraceae bacterium]
MSIIKKESLVEQIYAKLKNDIISLKLPLGSKINVRELQEKYGVSSTPLREAINRLQAENLVNYINNIGASVIEINEDDVYEIQDLTITLHTAAIKFAMARCHPSKLLTEIKQGLESYKNATTIEQRVMGVFDIFGVFYYNCGNKRLRDNMIVIQGQQLILRHIYGYAVGINHSDYHDLENIYKAVQDNDTEKIIQFLIDYTNKTTPVIIKQLGR